MNRFVKNPNPHNNSKEKSECYDSLIYNNTNKILSFKTNFCKRGFDETQKIRTIRNGIVRLYQLVKYETMQGG